MNNYNVAIIGAGNIGSRHLQALKKVYLPLNIFVVDVKKTALEIAKSRYDEISSKTKHHISYLSALNSIPKNLDIAIIATSANSRRAIIENTLRKSTIKYFILEKLLFPNVDDYHFIAKMLSKYHAKAWINCSMRASSFYFGLANKFNTPFIYTVTGSRYGLITNSIHYIDHMALLSGCYDFTVDTSGLVQKLIPSKRRGYSELNGRLQINFADNTTGIFVSFQNGNAPVLIDISSSQYRIISIENERLAWISQKGTNFRWSKTKTNIPYQSDITNKVVTNLLSKGSCQLTPYSTSAKLHIQLIKGLLPFLKKNKLVNKNDFPFT